MEPLGGAAFSGDMPVTAGKRVWVTLWLAGSLLGAGACRERPTTTVHLQGRVRTLGLQTPIAGAQVSIQWPASLGGGQSSHRTNADGQYVVERKLRMRDLSCAGLALSVEAPNFATAYARYTETSCGEGLLSFDFTLYPIPR